MRGSMGGGDRGRENKIHFVIVLVRVFETYRILVKANVSRRIITYRHFSTFSLLSFCFLFFSEKQADPNLRNMIR